MGEEQEEDEVGGGGGGAGSGGGGVASLVVVATLEATLHVLAVQVDAAAVRHPDDLRVGGQGTGVQSARPHHDALPALVVTSQLDAGGGREETIPVLPAGEAWSLEHVIGIVVVEGILTRGVVSVHRNTLEAVDPPGPVGHGGEEEEEEEEEAGEGWREEECGRGVGAPSPSLEHLSHPHAGLALMEVWREDEGGVVAGAGGGGEEGSRASGAVRVVAGSDGLGWWWQRRPNTCPHASVTSPRLRRSLYTWLRLRGAGDDRWLYI